MVRRVDCHSDGSIVAQLAVSNGQISQWHRPSSVVDAYGVISHGARNVGLVDGAQIHFPGKGIGKTLTRGKRESSIALAELGLTPERVDKGWVVQGGAIQGKAQV